MKSNRTFFACVLLGLLPSTIGAAPLGTAFTYQGRLTDGGGPATGIYDLRFTIFNADVFGSPVAGSVTQAPVPVTNGLFTVALDFGVAAFTGDARWLEVGVRTNGNPAPHTTLAPRQPISPTPYALHAASAAGFKSMGNAPLEFQFNGLTALRLDSFLSTYNVVGGATFNFVPADRAGITVFGGSSDAFHRALADFSTISGGAGNVIGAGGEYGTISGGRFNGIGGMLSFIGGGEENMVAGEYALVCGGFANYVAGSASSVGGGCRNGISANTDFATVGGGESNDMDTGAHYSTISGGDENRIGTNAIVGTIGGGRFNTIESGSRFGVIGGGLSNSILGGSLTATIPGGRGNPATNVAFATGTRATANHTGAFVWGDSTDADIASTNANSVTFRAAGGTRLFSDANATAGVYLAPGSGSWTAMSDRHAKENFHPVESREVLERVARLPVQTWNYKSQDAAIRHLGPMAQDFKAAFGVGESDTGITTVDADGVALAAIQGLNQKLAQELKHRDAENGELRRRLARLEERVSRIAGEKE